MLLNPILYITLPTPAAENVKGQPFRGTHIREGDKGLPGLPHPLRPQYSSQAEQGKGKVLVLEGLRP